MKGGGLHDTLRIIEGLQRNVWENKGVDTEGFKKEIMEIRGKIEKIEQAEGDDGMEKEIECLEKEIERNELRFDLLIQEGNEIEEELLRVEKQICDYEKEVVEITEKSEKELKLIEEAYHEEMLKNIERRNYIQKLRILKFENNKRKSRGNRG